MFLGLVLPLGFLRVQGCLPIDCSRVGRLSRLLFLYGCYFGSARCCARCFASAHRIRRSCRISGRCHGCHRRDLRNLLNATGIELDSRCGGWRLPDLAGALGRRNQRGRLPDVLARQLDRAGRLDELLRGGQAARHILDDSAGALVLVQLGVRLRGHDPGLRGLRHGPDDLRLDVAGLRDLALLLRVRYRYGGLLPDARAVIV